MKKYLVLLSLTLMTGLALCDKQPPVKTDEAPASQPALDEQKTKELTAKIQEILKNNPTIIQQALPKIIIQHQNQSATPKDNRYCDFLKTVQTSMISSASLIAIILAAPHLAPYFADLSRWQKILLAIPILRLVSTSLLFGLI